MFAMLPKTPSYSQLSISLDISSIVTQISKLYGGGASKDPNLSIGGGPNNFDTENALKIAKETLLKES